MDNEDQLACAGVVHREVGSASSAAIPVAKRVQEASGRQSGHQVRLLRDRRQPDLQAQRDARGCRRRRVDVRHSHRKGCCRRADRHDRAGCLDQFQLGPNGEVDVLIVPEGRDPDPTFENVVAVPPGTGQLAVRETFFDRVRDRPADLRIDLVGDVAPPILEVEEIASKMEFAALFVQFVAATAVNMWRDTAGNINHFGGTAGSEHVAAQDDEVRSHSNAEMTYHGGRWVLGEGEALVVTVHDPAENFLYWGLTTASAWMESLDYRYTTTKLWPRSPPREGRPREARSSIVHRPRALGRRRSASRPMASVPVAPRSRQPAVDHVVETLRGPAAVLRRCPWSPR